MPTAVSATMNDSAAQEFAAFYEDWFGRVYNYARHRTGSAVRADEIVSDTFARVFASWSRFDPEKGDRRVWLFAIAFRAVADHYRAEKRRRWLSLGLLGGPRPGGPREERAALAARLEEAEDQKRLAAALGELSDQQRELVSLKFFAGMTNRAIARITGLTEANVGVILFRCIRRMRRRFPGGEPQHG